MSRIRRLTFILALTLARVGSATVAQAECTSENPCTIQVVAAARLRVRSEDEMFAKMANAPATEHNIKAGNQFMDALKQLVSAEKESFSQWCAATETLNTKVRELGRGVLTSEDLFRWTGKPDDEQKAAAGQIEAKSWRWQVTGPFSGSVTFAINFVRPAGSKDPWVFNGCTWCSSGGVTSPGCVELPWKP